MIIFGLRSYFHDQPLGGFMALYWRDSLEIALALIDLYPEVDPKKIHFTELRQWVLDLADFVDDPNHCGERVLEAIQLAWMEEQDD